ncbi:DUF1996 domain-containing protein [Streptomyces sp. F63]|uniref:DUF1996 domain-containing protein n=1 Tax=Streptomyces sp. F63 TaxID=2824887 RepID=UPI001B389E2F|nr:DUF1996 domain-containing protein [Streptomyces sp. F63]MBQ0985268.1 DUF1996 domain-containing protein [Streptomyces sp. F63]
MKRNKRRRPTGARRSTFAAFALILGGGGLVAVNAVASATGGGPGGSPVGAPGAATISCPDVGQELTDVPEAARADVDKALAKLDQQITEAYDRLTSTREEQTQDANHVQDAILGPLSEQRTAVIGEIANYVKQAGATAPASLDGLAPCTAVAPAQARNEGDGDGDGDGGQDGEAGGEAGNGQDGEGQGGGQPDDNGNGAAGPFAQDFVDITKVQPNVQAKPRKTGKASTGTFTVECGVNENKIFNTDNLIVAPGVDNGAHHTHDYVGNQGVDAFASNDDLANAETSCSEQGDKSSYYWPVLRVQDGTQEFDAKQQGGGLEGNVGRILAADKAEIQYVGSPTGKVVAMPKFLRIITGDAKAFTNGTANANAHWSCTGFEDKVQLTDKYPICPQGSSVVRSFAFQSCWDGQNIDSANHRAHVDFADADGNCRNGFKAIPQLTMRLVYDVPAPVIKNGQVKNPYAVDGFPEQLHKPITDHDDFINVMDEDLMDEVVDCVNGGRPCGAGAGAGEQPQEPQKPEEPEQPKQPEEPQKPEEPQEPQKPEEPQQPEQPEEPQEPQEPQKPEEPEQPEQPQQPEQPEEPRDEPETAPEESSTDKDPADKPGAAETPQTPPSSAEPRVVATPTQAAEASGGAGGVEAKSGATKSAEAEVEAAGEEAPSEQAQPQPRAASGGLANTGATLWPAAAGGVLFLGGVVLLIYNRRRNMNTN